MYCYVHMRIVDNLSKLGDDIILLFWLYIGSTTVDSRDFHNTVWWPYKDLIPADSKKIIAHIYLSIKI